MAKKKKQEVVYIFGRTLSAIYVDGILKFQECVITNKTWFNLGKELDVDFDDIVVYEISHDYLTKINKEYPTRFKDLNSDELI